jgi:NifU-like protein involved in Fe-S cluster formation
MYSAQVLDHFENPRNAGLVENPDASVQIENPACGDILKLTLKLAAPNPDATASIAAIRFQAKGCVASMACASALTELVHGQTLAHARGLRQEDLLAAVGGLPPASAHAAHLALDALQAALDHLERSA